MKYINTKTNTLIGLGTGFLFASLIMNNSIAEASESKQLNFIEPSVWLGLSAGSKVSNPNRSVVSGEKDIQGPTLGIALKYRFSDYYTAGFAYTLSGEFLVTENHMVGVIGGLSDHDGQFQSDILLEAGIDQINYLGGLFTEVRGDSWTSLPYAGLRLALRYHPSFLKGAFIGANLIGQADLLQKTKRFNVIESLLVTQNTEHEVSLQGERVSLGVSIGWQI